MLVVTRYRVTPDDVDGFRADAVAALRALAARPGCTGATLGRAIDDPQLWTLTTSWESVGAYRRALSAFEVKLVAVPLMYRALDEPSAFEPLVTWTPHGGLGEQRGALATDPDHARARALDRPRAGPGDAGVTPDGRAG
ncbi:MAG TPA: antibiotic biosynthesis monooxygenase family protein [Kineosporiaceae bacterium]